MPGDRSVAPSTERDTGQQFVKQCVCRGAGRVADRLGARQPRSGTASGNRVRSLPTWAIWSIAVAVLLSPVLALLIAIVVEILIGALMDADVLPFFALVAAGAIGGSQLRKKRVRPRGATAET